MREFGSEFASRTLPDNYFADVISCFSDFAFLRSGRDALSFVAQDIERRKEEKCILLPAYCCDSMIYPFIRNGWKVYYYSLKDDLTVDLKMLAALIVHYSPAAVLLMNYFGIAPTSEAIKEINNIAPEITVIEDFTHCLFDVKDCYHPEVDYYVASIRKWLGINDGAIVLTRHLIECKPVYEENGFVNIREEAQRIKLRYQTTGKLEEKHHYRWALQKAEKCLAEDRNILGISPGSLQLLGLLNASEIKFRRRQNYFHLLELLKNIRAIAFPLNIEDVRTPFSLPILVKQRDMVQQRLAGYNLYVPVIWPITDKARHRCKVSAQIADTILAIPIDQRYDYSDMEEISDRIHSVLI